MTTRPAPLIVVTGASADYARCLWQLLRSARRHGLQRAHRFVVHDLGLGVEWRERLERDFPWCTWRAPELGALPPHVAPVARTYAWKPVVIHATGGEFGGPLLWVDSATLFQGPLDEADRLTRRHGVCTLAGQSALQDRCDPEVWRAVGAPPEILDRPERAAGVVGFDLAHPVARRVLETWRAQALDPSLWRSRSPRHRHDQSLLSILLHRAALDGELTLNPGEIDIASVAPVRWLTTRNKVPVWLPTWLDPLARARYGVEKSADRAFLRALRWKRRRIDGAHRWPQEHFQITLGAGSRARPVRAPRGSYYADPFLRTQRGEVWLFAEEFRYLENSGRLVALPVGPGFEVGPARVLTLPEGHTSFPFLIEHDGALLLLPETSRRRTVDLYRCEEFPERWRLERRVLADIDAADSTLLRHAGRWWLFTSVRATPDAGRHLELHHTDDLLRGAWTPHPVNAERLGAECPHGSGRGAGPWLRAADGKWLRPVQASRRHYGEGVKLMRVTELTPDRFREEPVAPTAHALAALAEKCAPHHVAADGGLIAHDVRTRAGWLPWRWRPG